MPMNGYELCQRCFHLPPPPVFSLEPPPSVFPLETQCPLKKITRSSKTFSTTLPSLFVVLGFLVTSLLIVLTLIFIKTRREQRRKPSSHQQTLPTSTVKNIENLRSIKFVPLLSESSSSDRMSNESPRIHEYEQIRDDYGCSSSDCCLVYCRDCSNYHPIVSSPCVRLYYLPISKELS